MGRESGKKETEETTEEKEKRKIQSGFLTVERQE